VALTDASAPISLVVQELEARINKVKAVASLTSLNAIQDVCILLAFEWGFVAAGLLQVIEDYKEKLQLRTDHHMG
jgi:hypothetical protein